MNLNGPADLPPDAPVNGINRHEARAFTVWAASLGGGHAGAVVQHEYQWEVAARAGLLENAGLVWEWCANPFHPYPDFAPFGNLRASIEAFERAEGVMRGASLHTQRCLRRASYRHHAPADDRTCVAGVRLVYPPGD
jgi:iron(II)-dependent oxidoreductase